MDFVLAIAEDEVPSTHEPDPYMHLFLDAGNGNACPDPEEEAMLARLDAVKRQTLAEWSETKRAPGHAEWLHVKERGKDVKPTGIHA